MKRKKYFQYRFYCNSAYYASLIAVFVVGVILGQRLPKRAETAQSQKTKPNTELQKTDTMRAHTDTVRAPVIAPVRAAPDTSLAHRQIDSLAKANNKMFDSVAEKYVAHLDSQYTLGKFFSAPEIKRLNQMAKKYIASDTGAAVCDTLLDIMSESVPLKSKLPLVTFESLIYLADIPQQDLDSFGIVFDSDHIDHFTDARRQKIFQQYLDAYSSACVDGEQPNFSIPEIAAIRQEYDANCQRIANLRHQIKEKSGH